MKKSRLCSIGDGSSLFSRMPHNRTKTALERVQRLFRYLPTPDQFRRTLLAFALALALIATMAIITLAGYVLGRQGAAILH